MGILNVDRLASLPRETQRRALEGAARRAAGDPEALAEVRAAARLLGLDEDGFQSATHAPARCPFHAASAKQAAPLGAEALRRWVDVPAVFRLRFPGEEVKLVAGTLRKVEPNAFGGLDLKFRSYAPKEAQKLLGEGTTLHVPQRLFFEVHEDRGRVHVEAAVPLSNIEGLATMAPAPSPRSRIGEAARLALREGHTPRVALAKEQGRTLDQVVQRPAHPARFLDDLKWDQNVLTAPLIDHVVTQALQALQGSASDLLASWKTETAERRPTRRKDAVNLLAGAFSAALREAIVQLDEEPLPGELAGLKAQLDELLAYKVSSGIPRSGRNVSAHLRAGAGTFSLMVEWVANALPDLFEAQFGRPGEPAELAAIFGRSFALLRNLARADLQVFVGVMSQFNLISGKAAVTRLQLVGEGDGLRVELRPEAADEVERTVGAPLDARLPGTTGCPALVTFTGANAIERLLSRFGAVLEEAYALDEAKRAQRRGPSSTGS